MPRKCISEWCTNKSQGKRRFLFPASDEQCQIWINLIPNPTYTHSSDDLLCEKHFDPKYLIQKEQRCALSIDAIPTLWPNVPEHLKKKPPRDTSISKKVKNCVPHLTLENLNQTLKLPTDIIKLLISSKLSIIAISTGNNNQSPEVKYCLDVNHRP